MNRFLFFSILILIFFYSIDAKAADIMVRPTADCTYDGDGTTWACAAGAGQTGARGGMPTTLVRGNTYYLADGSYGYYAFDDALDGTKYIYIKKATIAAHGTGTGWNNSFGDGQAIFKATASTWDFKAGGYYDIDGVTGSGTSGYGIKVVSTGTTENTATAYISNGHNVTRLYIKHVEFVGEPTYTRVFWSNSYSANNIYLSNNYFQGGRVWVAMASYTTTLEYNYFKDIRSDNPSYHGAGIVAMGNNMTIRYNTFENAIGSVTTYIEPQGASVSGYYVYGNIFKATSSSEYTSQGIFAITSTDKATDVKIYNNTIYGINSANPGVWCGNVDGSNCVVQNNIWQKTKTVNCTRCTTSNNNLLPTDSVSFVNPSAGDFRLSASTIAGIALIAPFGSDLLGNTRGSDGIWDRGAYEYVAGGGPFPSAPNVTPQ